MTNFDCTCNKDFVRFCQCGDSGSDVDADAGDIVVTSFDSPECRPARTSIPSGRRASGSARQALSPIADG
jgi:hypothetical protein